MSEKFRNAGTTNLPSKPRVKVFALYRLLLKSLEYSGYFICPQAQRSEFLHSANGVYFSVVYCSQNKQRFFLIHRDPIF